MNCCGQGRVVGFVDNSGQRFLLGLCKQRLDHLHHIVGMGSPVDDPTMGVLEILQQHLLATLINGAFGLAANRPRNPLIPFIISARIHEGVKFTNRDQRTLPQKFCTRIDSLGLTESFVLIADAYYACIAVGTWALDRGFTRLKAANASRRVSNSLIRACFIRILSGLNAHHASSLEMPMQ